METLAKICDTLQCEITDVIELMEELPEKAECRLPQAVPGRCSDPDQCI